jgi:threonine dehydrogenase-like Zn-dependent dehydrogenase
MKAVVIHAARDLRVEEREIEAPGPGQVEVAIEAGGICGSDLHYFNHGGFGTARMFRNLPSVTASPFLRAAPATTANIACAASRTIA